MKKLTLIVLGKNEEIKKDNDIEFIYSNGTDLKKDIKKAQGKYVAFIKEEDKIAKDYLPRLFQMVNYDFDCCFINYDIQYNYKNKVKINTNAKELAYRKPYFGEYIWAFMYNKQKLLKIIDYEIEDLDKYNEMIDQDFRKSTAIGNLIYFHDPKGKRYVNNLNLADTKRNEYYKNIIYVGDGCNGLFNGYISWINNLGRVFGNKYEITVLYDHINSKTKAVFEKYCKCVRREEYINYVCDALLVTYSSYYIPKNIFTLSESNMFIHGNMCDYPHTRKFYDDIYTNYIAVSKIAAKKAVGYFPTKKITSITNPFKLEKDLVKPHLTLVSAFRYCDVKRPDRVEIMANLLDELEIPYTWNLFTDQVKETKSSGLIYRKRVQNTLPYVKDSDYFVLLSDSEAMPYCILEALAVNTKVVVTPLEAYDELQLKNNKNATIIPFNYFDEANKDKLKRVLKKMYKEKEKKVKYKIDSKLWDGYNKVFKK